MKYFLFSLLLIASLESYSQRIHKSYVWIKGIYKSYEEFIYNSPSITDDFTTTLLYKSKNDSSVIGAEYHLIDTLKKIKHIWGFCDGSSVFIKYPHNLLDNGKYWKLEIVGPYSVFTYTYKNIVTFGPPLFALATATATALSPKVFAKIIVDENGGFWRYNLQTIKKLLKPYHELLESFHRRIKELGITFNIDESGKKFEQDQIKIESLIKEYLMKLNEFK